MEKKRMQWLYILVAFGTLAAPVRTVEIPVKSGEKIAFLGDSITAQGMLAPGKGGVGYCRLVISDLEANGIKVEPIGAGRSGRRSNDMLARLQRDVIAKKPDWMTLSCGVNDVWHGAKGVELADYKKNINEIVDKAQAAGIKVMILTATMIKEDAGNEFNKKLAGYNEFLRQIAQEKKCLVADLNAEMQSTIDEMKKKNPLSAGGKYLTRDGVHMNEAGNRMMAVGVLKGFGLSDAQLAKAREAWGAK